MSLDVTRQALGLAGLIFALVGVATRYDAVIWTAMAFLAASLVCRLVLRWRRRRPD